MYTIEDINSELKDIYGKFAEEERKEIAKHSMTSTETIYIGTNPMRRKAPKIGRNEKCPCGSGKKYKKCCGGINER